RVRKEGETLRLPHIVLSHDSPSRAEQSAAASEEPQNRMRASTGASLSAPKTGTASRAHAARIDRLLTLLADLEARLAEQPNAQARFFAACSVRSDVRIAENLP